MSENGIPQGVTDRFEFFNALAKTVHTVKAMRTAQKNYFRTRDKSYLDESKRLEKQVDAEIAICDERLGKFKR